MYHFTLQRPPHEWAHTLVRKKHPSNYHPLHIYFEDEWTATRQQRPQQEETGSYWGWSREQGLNHKGSCCETNSLSSQEPVEDLTLGSNSSALRKIYLVTVWRMKGRGVAIRGRNKETSWSVLSLPPDEPINGHFCLNHPLEIINDWGVSLSMVFSL